jgi:hypothetical protein
MRLCVVVIGTADFLRCVVQRIRHVVNVGHVAQELVERLDVMLQHFKFCQLFVPLGGAGNGRRTILKRFLQVAMNLTSAGRRTDAETFRDWLCKGR